MKELVVISGKGGTGKTSLVVSFAALSQNAVLADCDVDAADLHLVLDPRVIERHRFSGGSRARIRPGHCTACGKCEEVCRFDAIFFDGPGNGSLDRTFRVDPVACEGCGVCAWFCAESAVIFKGSGFHATDYRGAQPDCGRERPCCGRDTGCDRKLCGHSEA
jgi:MinD superfamily P-loop ATPase